MIEEMTNIRRFMVLFNDLISVFILVDIYINIGHYNGSLSVKNKELTKVFFILTSFARHGCIDHDE